MSKQQIHHVTDSSFQEDVLKASEQVPVLLDYWASWCNPCKIMGTLLDEIAGDYEGKLKICKMNIDDNPKIPATFGIRGIPTLMIFKNGQLSATKVGALNKAQLASYLNSNI